MILSGENHIPDPQLLWISTNLLIWAGQCWFLPAKDLAHPCLKGKPISSPWLLKHCISRWDVAKPPTFTFHHLFPFVGALHCSHSLWGKGTFLWEIISRRAHEPWHSWVLGGWAERCTEYEKWDYLLQNKTSFCYVLVLARNVHAIQGRGRNVSYCFCSLYDAYRSQVLVCDCTLQVREHLKSWVPLETNKRISGWLLCNLSEKIPSTD